MHKTLSAILFLALLGGTNSVVFAAELLDVKTVISGNIVSIEISADIPMKYTYYKVPGQARAVVDIAEADPEKVAPLIVVNKGAVSNISIDTTQISGINVSRIIFNLFYESDISVKASVDRKLLTVTFGGSTVAGKPETNSESKPAQPPEAAARIGQPAMAAAGTETASIPAAATIRRIPKLEPVVPIEVAVAYASPLSIKGVATGETYIEIRANQNIAEYKTTRMSKPERLIIDIAAAKIKQEPKTFSINKFGITKARIGISPKNIRIVIDSAKARFPRHTLSTSKNGLRINFD